MDFSGVVRAETTCHILGGRSDLMVVNLSNILPSKSELSLGLIHYLLACLLLRFTLNLSTHDTAFIILNRSVENEPPTYSFLTCFIMLFLFF